MSEAITLNKIENKAKKGRATREEVNLLIEAYDTYGVIIPKEVMKNEKSNLPIL